MAMQQLDLPGGAVAGGGVGGGKKGRGMRLGRLKRDGDRDKRGKSPKTQTRSILSASMEVPLPSSSSGIVLTQGEGYNPLAWDNTPAALKKQFPHWQTCSLSSTSHTTAVLKGGRTTHENEGHPFQISQKSQLAIVSPAHGIPYVVMDGDTLNSISLKFDTTPAELSRFNKKTLSGFSLFPGDVVYVPDGEEEVAVPTPELSVPATRQLPRKSAPPFLNYNSPTPERDAPPAKTVATGDRQTPPPTAPLKSNKKKLEMTRSQELFPKVNLEVRPGRKRTVSSSATIGNEISPDSEGTETYICITSKYITDDQGCVHGVLTVSTTSLMFKPNLSDPLVQEHGVEPYELLIPLVDVTHASLTRDIAPPRRLPFSSPRRQSSIRAENTTDTVVMEPLQQATPPENQPNKQDVDGKEDGAGNGMEQSPTRTMSCDTDVELERDSGTITGLSDGANPTEIRDGEEMEEGGRVVVDKKDEEGGGGGGGGGKGEEEEEEEGGEGDGERSEEKGVVFRMASTDSSQQQTISRQEDDDLSANPSTEPVNTSAEDLMAIITGEPPSQPRLFTRASLISLDALLGDTAYFLHLRVVSNSGQNYNYTPVNTTKGIDIPREGGGGGESSSDAKQRVKTLFCFVIPERNLEKVVSFLSLHHPQGSARLGSPSDKQRWTDGHFDVIHGPRSIGGEDLSFCDDHFKNPDSWEVYSLSDITKYRQVISLMEVEENLPLPAMSDESALLNKIQLKKLMFHLPSQAIGHDMHLVYSTYCHGISLRTMYRNMLAFGETPVLLVVKDDNDKVFGAMASSYLRLSSQFYGTGESSLFSFHDDNLEVFPWTGLNSYFIKGNTDSIVIGSGDGHFGLWLDEEFLHGSSYNCETFGNRPLATMEDFLCTGVEAWGFGSDR